VEFLVLCPNISSAELATRFPAATHFRRWEELRTELERRHGDGPVHVAVYPCAPLQIPAARGGQP
jgi:hypothetical protein